MRKFMVAVGLILVGTAAAAQSGSQNPTTAENNPEGVTPPTSSQLLSRKQVTDLDEPGAEAEVARLTEKEAQDRRDALDDFKKGAGLGISIVIGDKGDVIDDAVVVDNKIVVTRRAKDLTRAALEVHQLFTANPFTKQGRTAIRDQVEKCASNTIYCPLVGIGPFAAIQTGDNDSVTSAGLGMMIGVRSDPRQDSSFNIGVGLVFDSNTKTLATGFVEGQAPPTGETQVRFTEHSSRRLMITMSFAF